MKKIIFLFLLMIFNGTVFAQVNQVILFNIESGKDFDSIKVGDSVAVKFHNGKRVVGNIRKIESGYFIVGYDTILPEQIRSIRFKPTYSYRTGTLLMVVGSVLIIGGVADIVGFNSPDRTNDINSRFRGLLLIGSGLGFFISGLIINVTDNSVKLRIGHRWGMKLS